MIARDGTAVVGYDTADRNNVVAEMSHVSALKCGKGMQMCRGESLVVAGDLLPGIVARVSQFVRGPPAPEWSTE